MGFVATEIDTVPTHGFEWYIILLEDNYKDELRNKLDKNFQEFSENVGTDVLVVKGLEPEDFYPPGFDRNVIQGDPSNTPALLITSLPPNRINWEHVERDHSPTKVIFLPLSDYDLPVQRFGDFLQEITHSLKNPKSIEALKSGKKDRIENHWGWLNRYVKLEPNFFGFGMDVNEIIRDIVRYRDQNADSNQDW